MDDSVQDVFIKYFQRHSCRHQNPDPFQISDQERDRVFNDVLKFDQEPPLFA